MPLRDPADWGGPSYHEERDRELGVLRMTILDITNQHAPDALLSVAPDLLHTEKKEPDESTTTLCGATHEALLSCESEAACNHILYKHSLNASYHRHHTIGMSPSGGHRRTDPRESVPTPRFTRVTTPWTAWSRRRAAGNGAWAGPSVSPAARRTVNRASPPPPPNTSVCCKPEEPPTSACPPSTSTTRTGSCVSGRPSSVTMYQRRAQFRVAIAIGRPRTNPWPSAAPSYQGRASRPVPEELVEEIRLHVEGVFHLVNTEAESPLSRYARLGWGRRAFPPGPGPPPGHPRPRFARGRGGATTTTP